jgi:hypothetical protein
MPEGHRSKPNSGCAVPTSFCELGQIKLSGWPLLPTALFATVRNVTARLPCRCQYRRMLRKKAKTKPRNAILARVTKEMANPRVARSAREPERNLGTARNPEQPVATLAGRAGKIIPSSHPNGSENVLIGVDGIDSGYRDGLIKNSLADENGDKVRLKKRAHVEVAITAEPEE